MGNTYGGYETLIVCGSDAGDRGNGARGFVKSQANLLPITHHHWAPRLTERWEHIRYET
jgi:hypothetical protein